MNTELKVIIIGGVAGGMSAATRLRRLNEKAQITVIERGEFVSFANCGLPYHLSDAIPNREKLLLHTPQTLADRFRIDVRNFTEVTAINRAEKTVSVRNVQTGQASTLPYDRLILSPGASAVTPPCRAWNWPSPCGTSPTWIGSRKPRSAGSRAEGRGHWRGLHRH